MIRRTEDVAHEQDAGAGTNRLRAARTRNGAGRGGPATLRRLSKHATPLEIGVLLHRWTDGAEGVDRNALTADASQAAEWVRRLAEVLADAELVERQAQELPGKLRALLDRFLAVSDRELHIEDLADTVGTQFRSRYDLEASLAALVREGFLFALDRVQAAPPPAPTRRVDFTEDLINPPLHRPRKASGPTRWAAPVEIADALSDVGARRKRELGSTLSMLGYLQERVRRNHEAERPDPERAERQTRRIYKLYLLDSSLRTRVDALPGDVRAVFERIVDAYGGILPVADLDRVGGEVLDEPADVDLIKKCLEENVLGTVAPLRLERYGIERLERAVVVFHEVVFALAERRHEEVSPTVDSVETCGVDLCSNVTRFLREVETSKVQFTTEGTIYKASAKRISKSLLALPGGFMPSDAMLRFVYRVCLARRLVERSGERALKVSPSGFEFEQLPLQEKARALLAHAVEERWSQAEVFHQVRMRRMLLKLLRRSEVGDWNDLMAAPFLARNAYLNKLDEMRAEQHFAGRFRDGSGVHGTCGYSPSDTVHKLALSLGDFLKRRLFPLGIVDLGFVDGRPVAFSLTKLGAELLGADAGEQVGGVRSTIVVNPDFELILFPGDDEHEVVHTFDRFSERTKSDHVHHFRLTSTSVHTGLADGMSLGQILQELTDRSRVPLPQSVLYSLEDWGAQAGVLRLLGDGRLCAGRSELLDRFVELPQVAPHVAERLSPTEARLATIEGFDGMEAALRDRGFLLERA